MGSQIIRSGHVADGTVKHSRVSEIRKASVDAGEHCCPHLSARVKRRLRAKDAPLLGCEQSDPCINIVPHHESHDPRVRVDPEILTHAHVRAERPRSTAHHVYFLLPSHRLCFVNHCLIVKLSLAHNPRWCESHARESGGTIPREEHGEAQAQGGRQEGQGFLGKLAWEHWAQRVASEAVQSLATSVSSVVEAASGWHKTRNI
jgi:hypothetical protein